MKYLYLRRLKALITGILIILALVVIYKVCVFFFSASWTRWGLGKLFSLIFMMLGYVLSATFIYLVPPVLIYFLLMFMLKNPFLRVAAGTGCIYLFWVLGGGSGLFSWGSLYSPLGTVIKIVRLAVQIYLLIILVMPAELMSIIGTIAAIIGSIVIYFFPDAPGTLDDIAAVCTLMSMVFVYLNTLAMFIKRYTERIINFISSKKFLKEHK